MGGLVEVLVVVDAKYGTTAGSGRCSDAADLRRKETRGNARHDHVRRESVGVGDRGADGIAGNFRTVPLDRVRDRSVAEHAEVERLVRVLPDVLAVDDQVLPESLLQTNVELVAVTRAERRHIGRDALTTGHRFLKIENHRVIATGAGENKVFIERRFHRARVRNAQHGAGGLKVVGDPQARFSCCALEMPR